MWNQQLMKGHSTDPGQIYWRSTSPSGQQNTMQVRIKHFAPPNQLDLPPGNPSPHMRGKVANASKGACERERVVYDKLLHAFSEAFDA